MLWPMFLDIVFPLGEPRPKIYIHKTDLNVYLQDHHISLISYSSLIIVLVVEYAVAYLITLYLLFSHACARLDILQWAFPLNNFYTHSKRAVMFIDSFWCIGNISLQLEKLISMNAFRKMLKNACKCTRTSWGLQLLIYNSNFFQFYILYYYLTFLTRIVVLLKFWKIWMSYNVTET